MRQLGIYYSESLKTIIIGFEVEGEYRNRLVGRVIGHYDPLKNERDWPWHAFNVGYRYNDWHEGFVYVGRYTTFTTLKGYMDFLMPATPAQIDAYFKCKSVVEEYMKSYIVIRKWESGKIYERHYNKNLN